MLNYIVWDLKPQIFGFNSFEIRYYSLLFALGFIFGYYIMAKIFKKEGIAPELLDKLTIYVIIATVVGARLGHCLFYEPGEYLSNPLKIILPFEIGDNGFKFTGYQGLASHGGALGLLLGLYLWAKKYKRPYLWIVDRIAIVTALAGACIRLGNFFNSEIVGLPTDLPWGVKFMRTYENAGKTVEEAITRHPAQLYEAMAYIIIFIILIYLFKKGYEKYKQGFFVGLFFILVFTARFFIEFVKDNQVAFEDNIPLNMGQWLSIPFIIAGLILVFRKEKKKNPVQAKTDNK